MKYILILTLSIFSLSMSAQDGKKNEKAVIKTNIYCDHCAQCGSCGKRLNSGLLKISGVKMYELDEKNMSMTVYYNGEKTNLEAIRNAISKMGYDADDVKADPEAYQKLDGCCKKA